MITLRATRLRGQAEQKHTTNQARHDPCLISTTMHRVTQHASTPTRRPHQHDSHTIPIFTNMGFIDITIEEVQETRRTYSRCPFVRPRVQIFMLHGFIFGCLGLSGYLIYLMHDDLNRAKASSLWPYYPSPRLHMEEIRNAYDHAQARPEQPRKTAEPYRSIAARPVVASVPRSTVSEKLIRGDWISSRKGDDEHEG